MTVFPEFLQNTFLIDVHQFLRIVLGGQLKFFIYFHRQIGIREQLFLDLLFCYPDVRLLDQTGTF